MGRKAVVSPEEAVAAVEEYLRDCRHRNIAPRVKKLAEKLHVSPLQLSRQALLEAGYTFVTACIQARVPPRAKDFAASLGVSRLKATRAFRRITGKKLGKFLSRCHISHAKELLRTTALTVEQTAEHLGFRDLRTFQRSFKRNTGMTPRRFREQNVMDMPSGSE